METIEPNDGTTSSPATKSVATRHRSLKRRVVIAGCFTAVVLASVLGWYIWQKNSHIPPTRVHADMVRIEQTVGFPLFYPAWLPAGFRYQPNTAHVKDDNIVIFAISDGEKTLTVTEQPASVNYANFEKLTSERHTIKNVGKAVIVSNSYFHGAAIKADKTFIFINEPMPIAIHDFTQFVTSFQPAD